MTLKLYIRSGIIICLLLAICCCAADGSMLRPARNDVSNMADAIKYLQELDSYYSNVARPRLVRSESSQWEPETPELETAIQLLRLETIDRIYSKHTRPRFGKRSNLIQLLKERNQEDPDAIEWPSKFLPQR